VDRAQNLAQVSAERGGHKRAGKRRQLRERW
jgi:hypothetical protein